MAKLRGATYAEEVSNTHPIHRAASLDLRGHIYLAGGEHHRAALCFEKSLQDAKSAGSPLWVARAMRHIAHARMWFDPDGVMAIFPEAVELNEALGETVGVAQCEMAKAMAHSWMGDMVKAERFLDLSQSHEVDPVAIGHPWMVETCCVRLAATMLVRSPRQCAYWRVVQGALHDLIFGTQSPHCGLTVMIWQTLMRSSGMTRLIPHGCDGLGPLLICGEQ